MAIRSRQEGSKLLVEIDNGDLEKLGQCMSKWSFKDHQSLLRFAMSILLVTEENSLWIKTEGRQQAITPAKEYLKDAGV
jgi:hypothetical protein